MVAPWDRRSEREQRRVLDLILGVWLPEVTTASAYWRRRAEELGRKPSELSDVDDLDLFAPVRELDVLGAGPGGSALVVRPTEDEVKALAPGSLLRRVASAVSSGGPQAKRLTLLEEYKPIHVHDAGIDGALVVAYSRRDLDRLHRAGARAAAILGLDDADYLVSLLPPGPHLEWWGVYHMALGSSILARHPRHQWASTSPAAAFATVPATAVAVATHEAVPLAASLVEDGADLARVTTVIVVGPPPDRAARQRIADAWRAAGTLEEVAVRAAWAPSEARALWVECGEGEYGLHTYPDLEVLELLDPVTGEKASGEGDLAYTSAGWRGTALLRYRTGAYVESIETEPCPGCGRTLPRLVGEIAPGAWQVEATTVASPWYLDFRGAGSVLSRHQGIEAWRVEIRDGDVLVAEVAGQLNDAEQEELAQRLEAASGAPSAEVDVIADPVLVQRHAEEFGSVFADVR